MKNRLTLAACLAVVLLLVSCGGGGGGGDEPPSAPAFVPAEKSATLDAGGGSLSLTAADGTGYRFDLPAGAVTAPTTLTLATREPAQGQRFKLLLQPAGLVLARGTSGTLTITLPNGQALPAQGGLRYAGVTVPFTRLPDGRLQLNLSAFAGPATRANAMSVRSALSGPGSSRKHLAAASANSCGAAPTSSNDQSVTAEDALEIELYGQCMIAAVQALAVNEQFAEAVRVALSVSAYLMAVGSGNASQFIDQASGFACVAYRRALDHGRDTTVTTMGSLYTLVKPILFWETTIQQLGTACSGIAADDYQTVIHAKTDEALAYYRTLAPNLTDTTSANYAMAKAEASDSTRTRNEVLALNPKPALRNTVAGEVTQRAQPGLADAMLRAPWERCRNTRSYDDLIDLMTRLDGSDAVSKAAQYCGTVLDAQTRKPDATLIAQLAQPLGGVGAGVTRAADSIDAARNAILSISGPIQALRCPPGQAGGTESLSIKVDGALINTLVSAPYLSNPLAIDLAAALEAAHPGNTAGLSRATLVVERTGTPCGGYWGSNPSPLLTLSLDLAPSKIAFVRSDGIYVASSSGSGATRITSFGESPSWSPDRRRIAFFAVVAGSSGIYTVNADGSNLVRLTSHPPPTTGPIIGVRDTYPSWSPDGTRIAFARYINSATDSKGYLYVMNADGSGATEVATARDNVGWPAWSPDGSRIAFAGVFPDTHAGAWDIYVVNPDGSGLTRLTSDPNNETEPAWSPDSTRIAFSRAGHIYLINADGSNLVQLTRGSTYNLDPSWSPDGARIVFLRAETDSSLNLYVMNADGSGLAFLTSGYQPAW